MVKKQRWTLDRDQKQKKQLDDKQVEAFGKGAEVSQRRLEGQYPWEAPDVRPKLTRMIPLYISEPYKLKIKFIAEQMEASQQEILRQAVYPAVDQWIEKLTQEHDEEPKE